MTTRTAALRFRIWQYANPRGWDVTFSEVAEALGVSPQKVGSVAKHAGWVERFRVGPGKACLDARQQEVPGAESYARHLASQIAAGRVGVDL